MVEMFSDMQMRAPRLPTNTPFIAVRGLQKPRESAAPSVEGVEWHEKS